ncbi:helix-turn-helix transcriptional regulator [Rhizobium pisi]|uniref:helix-turn-helix transcriptional regulator n=1 Tax=Rhizobium pisi TaxID=574561 RepID=UPI0039AF5A92
MFHNTHYITASEVRQRFGNVCRKTLYRWIRDPAKNFPVPIRIGRRCLWNDAELRAFVAKKTAEAL